MNSSAPETLHVSASPSGSTAAIGVPTEAPAAVFSATVNARFDDTSFGAPLAGVGVGVGVGVAGAGAGVGVTIEAPGPDGVGVAVGVAVGVGA